MWGCLYVSLHEGRTFQVVSESHVQPETNAFHLDSVGYALTRIRSPCRGKEAHTKVEEKSRINNIYIKNPSGCVMWEERLYFVSSKVEWWDLHVGSASVRGLLHCCHCRECWSCCPHCLPGGPAACFWGNIFHLNNYTTGIAHAALFCCAEEYFSNANNWA